MSVETLDHYGFEPKTAICLEDATQLHAFEDLVAETVDPAFHPQSWAGRLPLKALLRPPKFNGRITAIELEVMDHPATWLEEAKSRGLPILNHNGDRIRQMPVVEDNSYDGTQYDGRRYMGFVLNAEGRSGARTVGAIRSAVWYFPIRPGASGTNNGIGLRRFMTSPSFTPGAFEAYQDESQKIGFRVLQQAITHPIVTSHRG